MRRHCRIALRNRGEEKVIAGNQRHRIKNSLLEADALGQFDEIALALSAQPGVGLHCGGHGDGLQ